MTEVNEIEPRLLSIKNTALRLDTSEPTVRAMIKRRELETVKIGTRGVRVVVSSLLDYLKRVNATPIAPSEIPPL